ncbi:hypothetical protein K2X05_01135 [bacterium]|nr:hypothetical protein [bacterium]
MSSWDSQVAMIAFAKSGSHLKAMKQSKSIATEIRIYSFEGDKLPSWEEAKLLILKNAKIHKFD